MLDRASACHAAPRGMDTGLTAFLEEIDTELLPLLDPGTRE